METNNEDDVIFSTQIAGHENESRKMIDEMDFFEMMENSMDDFLTRKKMVESVILNAQKGDSSSLRIVERALMESKYKNEQKLIFTDAQLRNIITLAADRIRGQGPLQSTPASN